MEKPETKPELRSPRISTAMIISSLRLLTERKSGLFGLVVLTIFVLGAIFANFIAPYPPNQIAVNVALQGPSLQHIFGTDYLGRDIFSRVVFGARISLYVGAASVTIGALIGTPIGLVSGYYRGKLDFILMRIIDMLLVFPALILAILIVIVIGPSVNTVVIAVAISLIPSFARVMRSRVLAVREEEFVDAARVLGYSDLRIMVRHVLPACISPVIVLASLAVAGAILTEASLSFLGLGVPPPTASWGADLRQAFDFVMNSPWAAIFPGLGISLAVLSLNMLGDALRDVLDPTLKVA